MELLRHPSSSGCGTALAHGLQFPLQHGAGATLVQNEKVVVQDKTLVMLDEDLNERGICSRLLQQPPMLQGGESPNRPVPRALPHQHMEQLPLPSAQTPMAMSFTSPRARGFRPPQGVFVTPQVAEKVPKSVGASVRGALEKSKAAAVLMGTGALGGLGRGFTHPHGGMRINPAACEGHQR